MVVRGKRERSFEERFAAQQKPRICLHNNSLWRPLSCFAHGWAWFPPQRRQTVTFDPCSDVWISKPLNDYEGSYSPVRLSRPHEFTNSQTPCQRVLFTRNRLGIMFASSVMLYLKPRCNHRGEDHRAPEGFGHHHGVCGLPSPRRARAEPPRSFRVLGERTQRCDLFRRLILFHGVTLIVQLLRHRAAPERCYMHTSYSQGILRAGSTSRVKPDMFRLVNGCGPLEVSAMKERLLST